MSFGLKVRFSFLGFVLAAGNVNAFTENFESFSPAASNILEQRFNMDPLYASSGWEDFYSNAYSGTNTTLADPGHIVSPSGLACFGPTLQCAPGGVPPLPPAPGGFGFSQGLTNVDGANTHGHGRALSQVISPNETAIFSTLINMSNVNATKGTSRIYLGADDLVDPNEPADFRAWLHVLADSSGALQGTLEYSYEDSSGNIQDSGPSIFPIDDSNGVSLNPANGWLDFALEVQLNSSGEPEAMWARYRETDAGSPWIFNPHDANQTFEPRVILPSHASGASLTHAAVQVGLQTTFDNILLSDTGNVVNNPGDVDGDGFVGGADLALVLSNWGEGPDVNWSSGDIFPYDNGILSGDRIVDGNDYAVVQSLLGTRYFPSVPEPTTSALLLLGGFILLVCRRQRSSLTKAACLAIVVPLFMVPTSFAAVRGPIGQQWVQQKPFQILGHQESLGDPNGILNPAGDPTLFLNSGMNAGWSGTTPLTGQLAGASVPWHFVLSNLHDYLADTTSIQTTVNNQLSLPNGALQGWHLQDDIFPPSDPDLAAASNWLKETTNGTDNRPGGIGSFDLPVWGTFLDFANPVFGGSTSGYTNYVNQWISTVQPDLLSYSNYPNLGGFVPSSELTTHYNNMMLVRNAAQQGAGTADDIPYTTWISGSTSRNPGPTTGSSELRMRIFSALTTGHKGINYFRYDGPGNLYGASSPNLVENQTGTVNDLYDDAQDVNAEVANLGTSLKFLNSTAVRYIKKGTGTSTPSQLPNYTSGVQQSQLTGVQITSPSGRYTDGMIGFFEDDKNDEYFLLTNLNFDQNIAANDALDFQVQFDGTVNSLQRLDRETGQVVNVPLTSNRLDVTLPGGTGELYKYDTGTNFAKEQQISLSLVPVNDPDVPEHYRSFDLMATSESNIDNFEMVLTADRAGSIFQHASGETYTEPSPGLLSGNPDLQHDTYVTLGDFSYPTPTQVTSGATILDPAAALTFDNQTLNIAWNRTNDTFDSGPGTFQVARITMQNRASATFEVRGEQDGNYSNPVTIEGTIEQDIQPMSIVLQELDDQTGVPSGFTSYDIMAEVDSDLATFEMLLQGGGPGSIFQHGSGAAQTEPDPNDIPSNPQLEFDTYVTMGAWSHQSPTTVIPGTGAVDIVPGATLQFDDEALNVLWTLTDGTSKSGPGTFQVARVTIADSAKPSWELIGWQADDTDNPFTLSGILNESFVWKTGQIGLWSDSSDWSPTSGPPGVSNDATINSIGSIATVNGAQSAASVTIANGELEINAGATLTSANVLLMTGGMLTGSGTVIGNVNAAGGSISPGGVIGGPGNSPGQLTIDGNLFLGPVSSSSMAIEDVIPGSGHGQIAVTAAAMLAGTLNLQPTLAYSDPSTRGGGDTFVVVTAATRTGNFTAVNYAGTPLTAEFGPTMDGSFRDHVGGGLFRNLTYTATTVQLQNLLALTGDTDGDQDIDLSDYTKLATNFAPTGTGFTWTDGNFDSDGDIDLSDYNALASNFSPAGYGAAAVPEPASVCLLLAGLLFLARTRFKFSSSC